MADVWFVSLLPDLFIRKSIGYIENETPKVDKLFNTQSLDCYVLKSQTAQLGQEICLNLSEWRILFRSEKTFYRRYSLKR